jgi:hypothetical protein
MLCVAPSLVVCAVFCPLSFGHCIVRLSLIDGNSVKTEFTVNNTVNFHFIRKV